MIKNKLKIGLVMSMVAMVAMSGMASAAVTTSYDSNITVDLSTADFTISSGSVDGGLVVGADNIVVTASGVAAGTFTVTCATKGISVSNAATGATVSQTCSSALLDTVVITYADSSSGNLTLTPSSGQCTYSTGGGAPAGGGGDTTPPTNTSISIAGGAESASATSVTLTLGATGASYMMIANDADFTDASWETYSTSKEWTLTTGDAEKTVYAKFKDSAGNVSATVSDTITLAGTGETEKEAEGTTEKTTTPTNTTTPFSEVLDGDIIQCASSSNPFAVYIVKVVGDTKYIRHIVSLEIFNYYGHLKWENLKQVDSLDSYSLSGWARVNTGPNGTPGATDKVYEINGDQSKHWINMTAEQFLTHGGSDPAIYTVNQGELDLYTAGPDVMSL